SALVIGALAGVGMRVSRTWVGLALAFGAGALISAVAFELVDEAYLVAGGPVLAAGLAAGALTFFAGNRWLHSRGAARRGSRVRPASETQGRSIVLGALLDGIPESMVLGGMLLVGGTVAPSFLAAVLLSNAPEGFSAAADLRREGHSRGWILRLWITVALASALAAAAAYALFDKAGPAVPFLQAFAAGALITMLVDTMIPEAYEDSGDRAGLVTVLGFALAFLLSAT
ncbi:MAG: ZIP family metal transporter, partial [Candidatus Limnocylindria bacterium]